MTDPRGEFNLANGRFEFEGEEMSSEPQRASQKDELLAFFLTFFDGWTPGTTLTVTNMEALERGRAKVAAMSSSLPRTPCTATENIDGGQ